MKFIKMKLAGYVLNMFPIIGNSNTPYIVQTVLSMTLLENEFKINSYIVMFFERIFFTIEKCN